MDAKPQRLRAFHAPGNENALPPSHPSLHQRHKSSGNLPTMPPTGSLKLAPKRTAFGDLSNTAKNLSVLDDSSTGLIKPSAPIVSSNKENIAHIPSKNGFLRPAQRPTALGIRVVSSNHGTGDANLQPSKSLVGDDSRATTFKEASTKVAPATYNDTASRAGHLPTSRPLAMRTDSSASTYPIIAPCDSAAAIHSTVAQGSDSLAAKIPASGREDPSKAVHSVNPLGGLSTASRTSEHSLQPRHHKSQPQLKASQPVLRRTQSRQIHKIDAEDEAISFEDLTEAQYLDAVEQQRHDPDYQVDCRQNDRKGPAQQLRENALSRYQAPDGLLNDGLEQKVQKVGHELPQVSGPEVPITSEPRDLAATALSEPEECWDDDDAQSGYDDPGYTTAHSYRSRLADITTVAFPTVCTQDRLEVQAAKVWVESRQTEDDIEEEIWDVSMVAEYGDEIFAYMRELEIKLLPSSHYMDIQTEIQWSMRSVLMDWLVQVHHRFALLPETLFLTVNYIDRFLSLKIVSIGKLQLVGATAILIASKYEEINCPSLQEIVFMVDSGYSVEEILKAERFMLSMLSFELGWPGPMSFLRRVSKADDYDLETRTLAKYFLEVTIMDERFVGSPPSFLAAGAHCLARHLLKKGYWTPDHVHYSGYTYHQLKPLAEMILECCESPRKHHAAVYDKYTDKRYQKSAEFVQIELSKGFTLPEAPPPQPGHHITHFGTTMDRMPALPPSSGEV